MLAQITGQHFELRRVSKTDLLLRKNATRLRGCIKREKEQSVFKKKPIEY